MQSCAQAVDCVRPEGVPWWKVLLGNPDDNIFLAAAPNVMCYKDAHLKLFLILFCIVPGYLLILIPYAVTAGDAHYVPRSTLYDFAIWKKNNTWRRAATRKATTLNLSFLTV